MEKLTQTSSVEADSKTDLSATIKDWLHDVWLVSSDKSEFIKIRMKINAFLTPNIFMSKSKAKLCSKSSKEHFLIGKLVKLLLTLDDALKLQKDLKRRVVWIVKNTKCFLDYIFFHFNSCYSHLLKNSDTQKNFLKNYPMKADFTLWLHMKNGNKVTWQRFFSVRHEKLHLSPSTPFKSKIHASLPSLN